MQEVTVDARHAVLETCKCTASHPLCIAMFMSRRLGSESWYTVDGEIPTTSLRGPLAGLYKTKDDGCVRLHTNFPQQVFLRSPIWRD
jgi:hypothetical protein